MTSYKKKEIDARDAFQLYFYENLFLPDHKSSILNNETSTKKTKLKLLNKIFELNGDINERKVDEFAEEDNINLIVG